MDENDYSLAFCVTQGIGAKGFKNLINVCGSAKDAWENPDFENYKKAGVNKNNFSKFIDSQKALDFNEYHKRLRLSKVNFVSQFCKYYPKKLLGIDNPPIGIFIKGNKELLINENIIAVVGARKITNYGRDVTEKLVYELCSSGLTIASGMALGVDGVAHKSALNAKGSTIAVLGCGVDCPYPRENDKLYEEILDEGGLVISEYPLGMPANAGTFPARNRIIAGISKAVLVTEAAEDSGSLITADEALKQGKIVFAVPGQITSQMSRGAIKLLKEGAQLVQSAEDIIENLQLPIANFQSINKLSNNKLSKPEQKTLAVLANGEMTIDELAKELKTKTVKMSGLISGMELLGVVEYNNGKVRIK